MSKRNGLKLAALACAGALFVTTPSWAANKKVDQIHFLIPYDAGGKLNAALLSGEVDVGSTGFSEAVALAKAGKMRVACRSEP